MLIHVEELEVDAQIVNFYQKQKVIVMMSMPAGFMRTFTSIRNKKVRLKKS